MEFVITVVLAVIYGLLKVGGDKLVFGVLRFPNAPAAATLYLIARIGTFIMAIGAYGIIRTAWRRAFDPKVMEEEGIVEVNAFRPYFGHLGPPRFGRHLDKEQEK